MKTLLTVACIAGLTAMTAAGQKTPAATAAPGSEATGKITEFVAGASLALDTGSGEPVRYKLGKGVVYVNARGKVVKAGKMKKDRKVLVHYLKDGHDIVIDKVTVVKN